MTRQQERIGSILLALALCVGLAGCEDMFGPSDGPRSKLRAVDDFGTRLFSPTWETGESDMLASTAQQVDWAIAETEEALLLLGSREGWHTLGGGQGWPEYRDERLPTLIGARCELTNRDYPGGQIVIAIINRNFELTQEAAERLRVHWMKRGWVVTDIFRELLPNGKPVVFFRADRYGGSRLSLYASDNAIDLRVTSACSPSSGLG